MAWAPHGRGGGTGQAPRHRGEHEKSHGGIKQWGAFRNLEIKNQYVWLHKKVYGGEGEAGASTEAETCGPY